MLHTSNTQRCVWNELFRWSTISVSFLCLKWSQEEICCMLCVHFFISYYCCCFVCVCERERERESVYIMCVLEDQSFFLLFWERESHALLLLFFVLRKQFFFSHFHHFIVGVSISGLLLFSCFIFLCIVNCTVLFVIVYWRCWWKGNKITLCGGNSYPLSVIQDSLMQWYSQKMDLLGASCLCLLL